MSSFAGLLFLLGGVALCVAAILLLVVWERQRSGRSPRRSLERYAQTRHSLHKIHTAQTTLRDSQRARARAMHPSARVPTARRPGGRHRKYA